MIDNDRILSWFRTLLYEEFGIREELVTFAATFKHDFGFDSFDEMSLMLAIEDEYEIDIVFGTEPQSANFDRTETVGDAIEFIKQHVTTRHSHPRPDPS